MAARVSLRNIRKVFDDGSRKPLVAIDGISLQAAQGEFLGIVGPSGCGKSTLLKIIAGLIEPTAGTVEEDGRRVSGPPERFVYLFQQYSRSLFPWRTVLANVMFPLEQVKGASRTDIRETSRRLIAQVGLAGFEDKYPWQLSGGMQQRIAIARALAANPDVLLLDEPFSAVDALTRMELQTLVLELCRQNKFTAILVTHDVEEAVFMADRVAVLTRRPTQIAEIVPIELARPRNQLSTRENPRFLELRHHLMTALLGDMLEAAR
jgi:NitT/TauT family transport system ATP-binding protein